MGWAERGKPRGQGSVPPRVSIPTPRPNGWSGLGPGHHTPGRNPAVGWRRLASPAETPAPLPRGTVTEEPLGHKCSNKGTGQASFADLLGWGGHDLGGDPPKGSPSSRQPPSKVEAGAGAREINTSRKAPQGPQGPQFLFPIINTFSGKWNVTPYEARGEPGRMPWDTLIEKKADNWRIHLFGA